MRESVKSYAIQDLTQSRTNASTLELRNLTIANGDKILDFSECTDTKSANIPKSPKNLHSHTATSSIVITQCRIWGDDFA